MTASRAFVGNTVTLTLVDGSPNDGDGTLDGVIIDPGGAALAGVPTTDPGDGGGSGTPDTTATDCAHRSGGDVGTGAGRDHGHRAGVDGDPDVHRMRMRRALVVAAALAVVATTTAPADASRAALQTSRAVVNISGNNTVISFGGSISGLAALQRVASVETVGYGGQGAAVCRINGVGNPAVQGQCLGEKSGKYWSYWRAAPGATEFSYSGTGAGGTSVSDGAVEGWSFGNGAPPLQLVLRRSRAVRHRLLHPRRHHSPPRSPHRLPPAAPVLTAPATVAPSGGGATTSASGGGTSTNAPGGSGSTGNGSGGTLGEASPSGVSAESATTSTTSSRERARARSREVRAAGAIHIRADDDRGTPWGVIAAGAGVVALGVGGFLIRSSRRSTPG